MAKNKKNNKSKKYQKNKIKKNTESHKNNKNDKKVCENEGKDVQQKKTLKERIKFNNKKVLLVSYYTGLAVLMIIGVGVILNNITKTEIIERDEAIAFDTEYIDDDGLELGIEEVEQEGEEGTERVYYKEESYLISGAMLNSFQVDSETTKEPTKKIVRRGTRKWQYMYCSDNTYMSYTDEQFQDKNTGFTHSSEDQCASGGHGNMVELADVPLDVEQDVSDSWYSSYSDGSALAYTPTYNTNLEQEESADSTYNYEEQNSYIDYWQNYNSGRNGFYENSQKMAEQNKARIQSMCTAEANNAGRNTRIRLGMWGGQADVDSEVSKVIESTYQSCMQRYGY